MTILVLIANFPKKSLMLKKCQLCSFDNSGKFSSTKRDLVITFTTKYHEGLGLLIRSLRTSGSHATIVIITTPLVKIPEDLFMCDINQIIVTKETSRIAKSPYKARWEFYYDYLKNHISEYDRVFHCDAFDSFFFEDPFVHIYDQSTLYFQMEDRSIRSCPYNKQWLLSCHYNCNRSQILSKTIACSGSLGGGIHPFIDFVFRMITHDEWSICWDRGFDQGDLNYILYTSVFPYNISLMNCYSGFITMQYCMKKLTFVNGSSVSKNDKSQIFFAHQYNRHKTIKDYIYRICHQR